MQVIARNIPEEVLPAFVEKLADVCFSNVYLRAPWRSGFLAMSLTKTIQGNLATIGPTASYAPFVSLGTRPHEIRPRGAKALAFVPGGGLGGIVFARRVQHPGTKPNPYMHLAAEDTRDQAFSLFDEVWKDYVGP